MMISTIGTHSSGQPSTKMSAMMAISMIMGSSFMASSSWVSSMADPRRENTAPKKFEAAQSSRIMAEISTVRNMEVSRSFQVILR